MFCIFTRHFVPDLFRFRSVPLELGGMFFPGRSCVLHHAQMCSFAVGVLVALSATFSHTNMYWYPCTHVIQMVY